MEMQIYSNDELGESFGQEVLSGDKLIAKALIAANDKIKELDRIIAEHDKLIEMQKPFVEFVNIVSEKYDSVDVDEMVQLLNKENIKIDTDGLVEFLINNHVLMNDHTVYDDYIDQGYFKFAENIKNTAYGQFAFEDGLITGKGQIWITEKLRHEFASC